MSLFYSTAAFLISKQTCTIMDLPGNALLISVARLLICFMLMSSLLSHMIHKLFSLVFLSSIFTSRKYKGLAAFYIHQSKVQRACCAFSLLPGIVCQRQATAFSSSPCSISCRWRSSQQKCYKTNKLPSGLNHPQKSTSCPL